jgi:hypothetical protein
MMKPDMIGWIATATFCLSYLCKRAVTLRRVQALGAAIWIAYGVAVHSGPVMVSNLIVISMAMLSTWKKAPWRSVEEG